MLLMSMLTITTWVAVDPVDPVVPKLRVSALASSMLTPCSSCRVIARPAALVKA